MPILPAQVWATSEATTFDQHTKRVRFSDFGVWSTYGQKCNAERNGGVGGGKR